MNKINIGDMLVYTDTSGTDCPAIVVGVYGDEETSRSGIFKIVYFSPSGYSRFVGAVYSETPSQKGHCSPLPQNCKCEEAGTPEPPETQVWEIDVEPRYGDSPRAAVAMPAKRIMPILPSKRQTASTMSDYSAPIFNIVFGLTGISKENLLSGSRINEVSIARKLASAMFKYSKPGMTIEAIGLMVGHTNPRSLYSNGEFIKDMVQWFKGMTLERFGEAVYAVLNITGNGCVDTRSWKVVRDDVKKEKEITSLVTSSTV